MVLSDKFGWIGEELTAIKLAQYLALIGKKGTWVITDQLNFHLQEDKKTEKSTGLEGTGQVKSCGCFGEMLV